jgi:hypothetical protein
MTMPEEQTLDEEVQEEEQLDAEPQEEALDGDKSLEDEFKLMGKEDLEALALREIRNRRKANAEAVKSKRRADQLQTEADQAKSAQAKAKRDAELAAMDETERVKAERDDERSMRLEIEKKVLDLRIQNEAISVATQMNFHNPADAAKAIRPELVLVDGHPDPEAIREQVQRIAESSPYLVKKPSAATTPSTPRTMNAPNTQPNIANMLNKNPVQVKTELQQNLKAQQRIGGRLGAANSLRALERAAQNDKTGDIRSGRWKLSKKEADLNGFDH